MHKSRILLGFHLLFFAGWAAYLLVSHRSADVIWLNTIPVDPRDILSGNYVALRYEDIPGGSDCSHGLDRENHGNAVYVRFEKTDQKLTTEEGLVEVWKPKQCQTHPPVKGKEMWMEGKSERGLLVYGIERFYVSEGSSLRTVQSGQVVAKVSVNSSFKARILSLVKITNR